MLNQNIGSLIHQHIGRFTFFNRVIPGADPHDFYFYIRVNRFRGHINGVDITDDFRNRERGDIANGVGFSHHTGSDTGYPAAFISTQHIG